MIKVDLITGFLGAGKTTFIRRYLRRLKARGTRVLIIENEFGPLAVDSAQLSPDLDDDCSVRDLTGMCMCCVGKSEFIDQLRYARVSGVDRIIVEPSGIYDVDEFFSVMEDPIVEQACEIGAVVTLIDASDTRPITPEVRYLTFCQLAASGAILISKTDRHDPAPARARIAELMREFADTDAPIAPILETPLNDLTDEALDRVMESGCNRLLHDRLEFSHTDTFSGITVEAVCRDRLQLEGRLRRLFRSNAAGRVFRVKGIARTASGETFEVNNTPGTFSVTPAAPADPALVIIGQSLNRPLIEHMFAQE